jgi:hypothetical protein
MYFHRYNVTPNRYETSWLFPQIDAALHHGGAGTTGASLRGEMLCQLLRRNPSLLFISRNTDAYQALVWVPTASLKRCRSFADIHRACSDQYFWASRVHKLGVCSDQSRQLTSY